MVSSTTSVNNRIGFTSSCKEQSIDERNNVSNNGSSHQNKSLNESKMSVPIAFERNYYIQNLPNIHFGNAQTVSNNQAILNTPTTLNAKELTGLDDENNKQMYNVVFNSCSATSRKGLNYLLNKNILFDHNSNDQSSVLTNLYKIATTKRAKGLSNRIVLDETIRELCNPFSIEQKFGTFSRKEANQLLKNKDSLYVKTQSEAPINNKINSYTLNPLSNCCVAASMEFNLASKHPAEFARMVENVTSEQMTIYKKVHLNSMSDSIINSINDLVDFKVDFENENLDYVTVMMKPDKNAIIRAQKQSTSKKHGERSCIDVLLQSTFMSLGTQGTYNSLTDTNDSIFSADGRGLTAVEKNFVEQIVEDKNKVTVTYQMIDENNILQDKGDYKQKVQHLVQSLNHGSNVIVGITYWDKNNRVTNGHELTVVGYKTNKNNELVFILNDTDDEYQKPIEMKAKELIPRIHHAGIPGELLSDEFKNMDYPKECLDFYNEHIKSKK